MTPPAGPGPAGPGHEPTEGSSPPDTWYPPLDESDDSLPVVTVPEPSSLGLLGVGILALLAGRRRSARSRNR